jgi:metallo-beta-lactamase family protein
MGEEIRVSAQIHNLDGFSAHADKDQLLAWLAGFTQKPAAMFIVHGEQDMAVPFARTIDETFHVPAYIPQYGDTAVLDGREWKIVESSIVLTDPSLKRMSDYLRQIEEQYKSYKEKIERKAQSDSTVAADLVRRLERLERFMRNAIDEI